MGIEAERHLAFHCSLGPDVLLIRNFSGGEKLGECFEYTLTLYSTDADIKAEDLLGQHASIRVKVGSLCQHGMALMEAQLAKLPEYNRDLGW